MLKNVIKIVLLTSLWVLTGLEGNSSIWVQTEQHPPGSKSEKPQGEAIEEIIIVCA